MVIDETQSEEEESQSSETAESEKSDESDNSQNSQESEDSEDDSVRPSARNTKRKPLGIPSDSEDEEDELEQRALSPSTRMSITGVRPQDLSDDDSEIEYSDEVQEGPTEAPTAKAVVPRYTTQFAGNIQNDLHSTIGAADSEVLDDSSGSDVLILSNKETPIEILSSTDDDATTNKENMSGPPFERPSKSLSPRSSAGASVVKTSKNLSQPTIQAVLKQKTSPAAPRRSRIKSEDQKVVSQVVYDEEMRKLAEKRVQVSDAEKLFEKVAHKLPDKGSQIMKRIDTLRRELAMDEQWISALRVQQSNVPAVRVVKPTLNPPRAPSIDTLDWDELSEAVNEIKPVYTGAQGMATFNNQKALTLESLKVRLIGLSS